MTYAPAGARPGFGASRGRLDPFRRRRRGTELGARRRPCQN